jgi:small ligand-binding sensory domain FIST
MLAAGTGLAVGGTVDDAALEASLAAVERSGTDRADLALVFVTGDAYARAHEALHAVRRVTGAPIVVGCSGTGILTERREVEGELAVAVLSVRCDRLVATPFSFERQGERRDLGTELAQRIGSTVAEGGCALVLPDAMGGNPPALLASFTSRSATCRCSARSQRARRCSSSTTPTPRRARSWASRSPG